MAVFPVTSEQLEDFINRVTMDKTSQLIESLAETIKEDVPKMVEDYLGARFEAIQATIGAAKQEASEQAEAVRMTSAQALGEAETKLSQAVTNLEELSRMSLEELSRSNQIEVDMLKSQDVVMQEQVQGLQEMADKYARSADVEAKLSTLADKMEERMQFKIQQTSGVALAQTNSARQTSEMNIRKTIHELATDTHTIVGELHKKMDEVMADKAAASVEETKSVDEPRPAEFHIGSPDAEHVRTDGPRRRAEREIRVNKPTYDKLGLKTLKDESAFKPWGKSLDMAFDDIWVGIEGVLKNLKTRKEKMTAEEFEQIITAGDLRSPDVRAEDWSYKVVSRYLYGVLYNHTSEDLQGVVEQCEEQKDGLEAYRLLSIHCDPVTYNTSNTLMENITRLGRRKVSSNPMIAINEFLTTVRDVRKSLTEYEARVAKLPDAKSTWVPSMMIELMNGEMLTFVRQKNASGDLDGMEAAIKELRQINKSIGIKANLRQMNERTPEPMEEELSTEDDEAFHEWAAGTEVSKDQILAAIGKGSGKGGRPRFQPKRDGQRPRGPAPPGAGAKPTGGPREEKRRCFNCDEIGHIGKDCPHPDKRLAGAKKPPNGSAKSLRPQVDQEGFQAVASGVRPRLCMMRSRPSTSLYEFQALRAEDEHSEDECECIESVKRSTANIAITDKSFPEIIATRSKRARRRMRVMQKKTSQRKARAEKREVQHVVAKYEDTAKGIEQEEQKEDAIPPPPSIGEDFFRRKKTRHLIGRWQSRQCGSECDCKEAQENDDESCVSDDELPGMADSDDEEDIPEVSDSRLSPKQLERRELRQEREEHERIRNALTLAIDAVNDNMHSDLHGSSAGLPLATDDARHDPLYKHEMPRGGRGETHQSVDSDLDLLGLESSGLIPIATVFGKGMAEHNARGQMHLLYEKKGVLNAVNPAWERLTLTVDSGASDTVVPRHVCTLAPLTKGPRFGTEYEVANGETIDNEGERDCLMRVGEGDASNDDAMQIKFQVVDVSKALLSVHRVCEQGHNVIFSKKDGESAILVNGDPENRIPLRNCGGTYELDVYVRPNPVFSRQR